MKSLALSAVCAGLTASSYGAVTFGPISRHVNASSYIFVSPDFQQTGDRFSLTNHTVGVWIAGVPLDFSDTGTGGTAAARSNIYQWSDVEPDHLTARGTDNASTTSTGDCSGTSAGEWFYFIQFIVDSPTYADVSGAVSNISNGSVSFSIGRQGFAAFFTSVENHSTRLTLMPGSYYYNILSHSQTQCSNGCEQHSEIEISADVLFSAACLADFNHDSVLDFFDYLDFVDAFSYGGAGSDFNGDNSIDFFDYLDFVGAFSSGC